MPGAKFRTFESSGQVTVPASTVDKPKRGVAADIVRYPKPPDVRWSLQSYPYADPALASLDDEPTPEPVAPGPQPHRRRNRRR